MNNLQKQPLDVFLEISQNSQKNTSARVSFLNKVTGWGLQLILKSRLWHRCFFVNFAKFLWMPFMQNSSGRLFLNLAAFNYPQINHRWMLYRLMLQSTSEYSLLSVLNILSSICNFQKQLPEVFWNLALLTRKRLCWSLFLIKLQSSSLAT